MGDTDEDIGTTEIEEDWIEYLKRSTRLAEEKMRTANFPCCTMTHKKMKWRLALRIASQPETRWSKKAAKWNPCLGSGCKASRAMGRPRKRWEDDMNQFRKPEETEETKGNDLKNKDTWMRGAQDQLRWKEMDKDHTRNKSERC